MFRKEPEKKKWASIGVGWLNKDNKRDRESLHISHRVELWATTVCSALDVFLMWPLGKWKYKATLNQPFLNVQIRTRTACSHMKPLTLRNWNNNNKNTPLRFNLEAKIRPRTWLPLCCFRGLRMDSLSGGMETEKGRGARFRSEDLAIAASLWGRREANRPAVWGRHKECYCRATQKALNLCACPPLDLPDHFLNQFCGWTVVSTWELNPHFPSYWWSSEFGFPFW